MGTRKGKYNLPTRIMKLALKQAETINPNTILINLSLPLDFFFFFRFHLNSS